jgi:hypothetical protein
MDIRYSRPVPIRRAGLLALVAPSLGLHQPGVLGQQPTIPVRPLGAIIATSAKSLSDASSIRVLGLPLAQRRVYVEPADLPDYRPPFTSGFARADAEGNVWVRANQPAPINGGAVYDVISRNGELVDRVQLPNAVVLAGFAPGTAFLVSRGGGAVRLSKARIH